MKTKYTVYYGLTALAIPSAVDVIATSVGNAARLAFRKLIADGLIKNQPRTCVETGGWVGVAVIPSVNRS